MQYTFRVEAREGRRERRLVGKRRKDESGEGSKGRRKVGREVKEGS